jgi:hypothetical protein
MKYLLGMTPSPIRLRWPLLVLMASIALTAFAAFDAQRTVRGAVRASVGIPTSVRDIDRAVEVVESFR